MSAKRDELNERIRLLLLTHRNICNHPAEVERELKDARMALAMVKK